MKPTFIWDLDGTLFDSYDVIVDSLCDVYKEKLNIDLDKEEVRQEAIRYSVGHFLARMEKETGVLFKELKERYSAISGERKLNIKPMKHSIELLDYLKERGIHSYVFTHRGTSTEPVLRNINMYDYFDEIITSVQPFKRKPSPDAINYLVEKYHLDKEHTYYVGDRSMDMECAKSAGIKGIMYLPKDGYGLKTGKEDYIIEDLLDIKDIIDKL